MEDETRGSRMFRTPTIPAAAAGLLALGAAACGDGPSTGPEGRAARIVAVSPDSAGVDAASEAGAPLRVRVVGEDGEPREGVEVRFLLASGPGRAVPRTASTDAEGTAEAAYVPGGRLGEARLRADVPDAPWMAPVLFRRTVRPTRQLRLSAEDGGGQRAEAGSQLPRPLSVTARTESGEPEPGARIAWEVASAPGEATLSADTALTGGEGAASVLLTLAGETGEHRVRALVAPPAASDTVVFSARSVGSLASGMRLDSARPRPLRPGREATLWGEGLDGASELWMDGASVAVSGGDPGRAVVRLPGDDGCRPRRRTTLRVRGSGGGWSNGLEADVAPAEPALDLAVGEARTLAAPGPAECVRLPASSGRAYRVALAGASRSAGARTPLALRVRRGVGGLDADGDADLAPAPPDGDDAAPTAVRSLAELRRTGPGTGSRGDLRADRSNLERRLRRGARAELRRRGARPSRASDADPSSDGDVRASPAVRPRSEAGDTLRLDFAVSQDMSIACSDTANPVTAVVRAAGPGVAVVQDTAAPAGLTPEDFALIRDEFEELVLPTDTAYFGPPADIDGNGRVLLLLTPRVNDLTPPGSESRVGGFFLPLDLADSGAGGGGVPPESGATCPASNEGELLYLASADPDGSFGPPLDRTGALRNARSIGSHELQHLLSAEQRLVAGDGGFADLEEVWLAEGLAHLAEEVVGLGALGMEPGSNLDFGDFDGSRERLEAFNTFHLQNFGRLQLFLSAPTLTPALASADPGGTASLRMRGFAWLFSRWLADHAGNGPAGGERALVRRLSSGGSGHLTGVENVEGATGSEWRDLLLDFATVPPLEGREAPTGSLVDPTGRSQLATWNLPALYEGLSDNPSAGRLFPAGFPLQPVALDDGLDVLTLELPAAAPAYLSVGGSPRSPALALRLSASGGGPPPASADLHLTVIRVR